MIKFGLSSVGQPGAVKTPRVDRQFSDNSVPGTTSVSGWGLSSIDYQQCGVRNSDADSLFLPVVSTYAYLVKVAFLDTNLAIRLSV